VLSWKQKATLAPKKNNEKLEATITVDNLIVDININAIREEILKNE
jgi:hypothetical protein